MLKAVVIAMLAIPALTFAQAPGAGVDSPIGRDAAKPSDGAITGGSIRRGGADPAGSEALTSTTSEEAVKRCNEMSGTLREQCLVQERGSGAGGTRAPGSTPDERKADPRAAPPPQNPR